MLNICICDDNKYFCNKLKSIIELYEEYSNISIDLSIFFSGESLYEYIKNRFEIDILFLDINLKNMDGIEVGSKLRNEIRNETTQIIYLSCERNYAIDLFQNRPFDFILKPINQKKIFNVINKYIELYSDEKYLFQFTFKQKLFRLPFKDILYFESNNKKIEVFSILENYRYYGNLSDVLKILPKKQFIQIHKSIVVNYKYIYNYSYKEIELTNNINLPISQKFRPNVREYFLKTF